MLGPRRHRDRDLLGALSRPSELSRDKPRNVLRVMRTENAAGVSAGGASGARARRRGPRAARGRRRTSARRAAARSAGRPRSARTASCIAGCWVRLNGYENGVHPSIASGVIGACPAGRASKAGTATDGVTTRSKRCHELAHRRPELAAAQVESLHVEVAQLRSELGLGGEVGIGDRLLLGAQRVPQRPRAGEPQPGRDLQRVVEPGIDGLDDGAGGRQLRAPRRRRPRRPRGARRRSRASARRRCAGRRCRRRARRGSRCRRAAATSSPGRRAA